MKKTPKHIYYLASKPYEVLYDIHTLKSKFFSGASNNIVNELKRNQPQLLACKIKSKTSGSIHLCIFTEKMSLVLLHDFPNETWFHDNFMPDMSYYTDYLKVIAKFNETNMQGREFLINNG